MNTVTTSIPSTVQSGPSTWTRDDLDIVRSAFLRHVAQDDRHVVDATVRQHLMVAAARRSGVDVIRHLPADPTVHTGAALLIATDDMPLLVDALTAVVAAAGLTVEGFLHPVIDVRRDGDGRLVSLAGDADVASGVTESWMRIEVTEPATGYDAEALVHRVRHALVTLRRVHADAEAFTATCHRVAEDLEKAAEAPLPPSWRAVDVRDTAKLLRWLTDGTFLPLGYQYRPFTAASSTADEEGRTEVLGLYRDGPAAAEHQDPSPPMRGRHDGLLAVTADSALGSPLGLRPHCLAVIACEGGTAVGEHLFLGLFTVTALHENVLDVPVLARRVREVMDRAGHRLESHTGQAILEIIQDYPRPELFAVDTAALYDTVVSIDAATAVDQLVLVLRPALGQRVVSALIYLPRDRYNPVVRAAMQHVIADELGAHEVEHAARVSESPWALVHFTAHVTDSDTTDWADVHRRVHRRLQAVSRTFDDEFRDCLIAEGSDGAALATAYAPRLSASYTQDVGPVRAAADVRRLHALRPGGIDVALHPASSGPRGGEVRLVLYTTGERVSLSSVLPILISLGVEVLDERPHDVTRPDGLQTSIYDFGLHAAGLAAPEGGHDVGDVSRLATSVEVGDRLCDTFAAAWCGNAEVDALNELVLSAALTWREVALLRAYAKYLGQLRFPHSGARIASVLLDHPSTARDLVDLFAARFDPRNVDDDRAERLVAEISARVDGLASLEADHILSAYLTLLQATTRTNYYLDVTTPGCAQTLALKFAPQDVALMPRPRPRFEVFVYSPHVEGVHLRFGRVARGGIRWSDRVEDFRTEVLGLAKAQAVKNAVIVPAGAKGGFVVKRPPAPTGDPVADRDALTDMGKECYRAFVGALLDITDNVDPRTGVVFPPPILRRDGDDTYLVVAADKGTATFSDIANAEALERGFWLGDAFASGGSVGYDHKAMGITAKGAWESVTRHFGELGIDTHSEDFTVVGIGDMSGDVFGNGMLLSRHIRLVAAFDHRHVFVDPNPDAIRSHDERRRLYELPRSTWNDYDRSLISPGGGVWSRTAKSIPISPPMREALGLNTQTRQLPPNAVIAAILRAPVDLLWNGGVGTYVKSGQETNDDVGDKANDDVRVEAASVAARVIGEGGNLGVTPLGRIEYARRGGRINTDALDNSAGVDCSDHEVNIKILLDGRVAAGELDTSARNALLASMTHDVETAVLANNVAQNEWLGTSRSTAARRIRVHGRLIRHLETLGDLDRTLEALPSDAELTLREKQGAGLTSPELTTLAAHVKLALKAELSASTLLDGAAFTDRLLGYFPPPLQDTYSAAIPNHRLRREIVATVLTNEVIAAGGVTFVFRLTEDAGVGTEDAIRAYVAARAIFDVPRLIDEIRRTAPSAEASDHMLSEVRRLLDRLTRWLLNHRPQPTAVGAEISRFADPIRHLFSHVPHWLRGADAAIVARRASTLTHLGVDTSQATTIVSLLHAFCAMDIIDIADMQHRDLDEVAELYYALNAHLDVDLLLTAITDLDYSARWNALARQALRADVYDSMRALCVDVLTGSHVGETPPEKIADWELTNRARLTRARNIIGEIFTAQTQDLASLSVAASQLRLMVSRTGVSST